MSRHNNAPVDSGIYEDVVLPQPPLLDAQEGMGNDNDYLEPISSRPEGDWTSGHQQPNIPPTNKASSHHYDYAVFRSGSPVRKSGSRSPALTSRSRSPSRRPISRSRSRSPYKRQSRLESNIYEKMSSYQKQPEIYENMSPSKRQSEIYVNMSPQASRMPFPDMGNQANRSTDQYDARDQGGHDGQERRHSGGGSQMDAFNSDDRAQGRRYSGGPSQIDTFKSDDRGQGRRHSGGRGQMDAFNSDDRGQGRRYSSGRSQLDAALNIDDRRQGRRYSGGHGQMDALNSDDRGQGRRYSGVHGQMDALNSDDRGKGRRYSGSRGQMDSFNNDDRGQGRRYSSGRGEAYERGQEKHFSGHSKAAAVNSEAAYLKQVLHDYDDVHADTPPYQMLSPNASSLFEETSTIRERLINASPRRPEGPENLSMEAVSELKDALCVRGLDTDNTVLVAPDPLESLRNKLGSVKKNAQAATYSDVPKRNLFGDDSQNSIQFNRNQVDTQLAIGTIGRYGRMSIHQERNINNSNTITGDVIICDETRGTDDIMTACGDETPGTDDIMTACGDETTGTDDIIATCGDEIPGIEYIKMTSDKITGSDIDVITVHVDKK